MPLISIIVPCYNQSQYLDECLQSVLHQTFTDWECIIVNDGSPDNTEEVAAKWVEKDARFHYYKKENGGVASARNFGIEKAIGDFIQLLDGDDILEKEKLQYQSEILKNNKKIDIVYGSSRYFFDKNPTDFYAIHPTGIIPSIDLHYTDHNQLDVLLIKNICTICAALYRKEVFTKVKFENTIYEDFLLHIQASFKGFIFHFQSQEQGNCLIRITENSQMLRHMNDKKDSIFAEEIKIIKGKYLSKLIPQNNTSQIKTVSNNKSVTKKIYENFFPPILQRQINKYIRNKTE